ncbi:unnamed protein product [Bursaphelenchus xylophilus]|uniref:(pine wood nematode) hypothetical protein n=1 Tax=Bursaphelenchus xylophilus TaxID=6326 RepID=A0A1I7S6L2_BURXY|nr:unnamed protein product [Bursaphelenchus xylophilus]CAG9120540.1 unnamed protein product [Bursaphelenchus xylophilus]
MNSMMLKILACVLAFVLFFDAVAALPLVTKYEDTDFLVDPIYVVKRSEEFELPAPIQGDSFEVDELPRTDRKQFARQQRYLEILRDYLQQPAV